MDPWDDLVTAALVGTERRQATLPAAGGALGDLLARLDGAAPERALLGAAAAVALHRRAGRRPATDRRPLPEPCPLDDAPACGSRAAARLHPMLEGRHREVLPEWLAALAAAGNRAPDASLPALLDLGRQDALRREAILPVLGARGRWLAAQNPDWDYAVPILDAEAAWQTGDRARRRALLRRLRQDDPDRARDLVAATWAEDTPEDHAAFLAAFETGLSLADEPFLEAALDDRRKEVRAAAAELLALLPESRLVGRMIERTQATIALTTDRRSGLLAVLGRNAALTVTPPTACDEGMIRDGIDPKPSPGIGFGSRAWWLAQMLARVPPSIWSRTWGVRPATLLELADQTDWKQPLRLGWMTAAGREGDPDWIEAILDADQSKLSTADPSTLALIDALPPERREAVIRRALAARMQAMSNAHPAHWLLLACRNPMSIELGRAVLARLYRAIRSGTITLDWQVRSALGGLAQHLPPALAAEAASDLPTGVKHWGAWEEVVGELLALLQFRHDMLKEIAE